MAKYYNLKVSEIKHETPSTVSLFFHEFPEEFKNYLPGQYITLRVKIGDKSYNRSYSLSSSPTLDNFLRITVKELENGTVSKYLKRNARVGETFHALPPLGNFTVKPHPDKKKHYVFIAGGSGITPVFSMIREILHREEKSKISLLYSNHTKKDTIFKEELDALKEQFPKRFKIKYIYTRKGMPRIEGENAVKYLEKANAKFKPPKEYYVCGPAGLIQNTLKALEETGVSKEQIHIEYYDAPVEKAQDSQETPSEKTQKKKVIIRLDGETHTLEIPENKDILGAALDAGLEPPYACQSGICASCRAKLLKGEVRTEIQEGLTEDEKAEGFILTCQAFPVSEEVEIKYQ